MDYHQRKSINRNQQIQIASKNTTTYANFKPIRKARIPLNKLLAEKNPELTPNISELNNNEDIPEYVSQGRKPMEHFEVSPGMTYSQDDFNYNQFGN